MAHDVFISYSTKDKTVAEALCATLEAHGIQCWIAPRDIPYGSDYGEAIVDGLNESRVMVLVFSSNANTSEHITREVDRAVSKGLTIIPIRIEDVAPTRALEYYISPVHWVDAVTPPIEGHLRALAGRIQVLLSKSAVELPAATPGTAAAVAVSPAQAAPHPVPATATASRRFGLGAVIGVAVGAVVLGAMLWTQPWSPGDKPSDTARLAQIAEQNREETVRQARLEEQRREEAAKRADETKRAEETAKRLEETKRAEEAAKRVEETKRAEETAKRLEEARKADEARRAKLLEEQKRVHQPVVAKLDQGRAATPNPAGMKVLVEQKLRIRGLLKQSSADQWGVIVDITNDGVITLTGVLHNNDERTETVRLAAEVPGVTEVKQRINIPQSWNAR